MTTPEAAGNWRIEYDNDVGPDDGGFWEWWSVTDGTRSFRAGSEAEAEWLRDALAALSQPDEAPSGYKLVPMRPTPEMIDAAIRTINARKTYGTKGHNVGQMLTEEWIAMIHAAPAAMSKEQP